jgi:hypothetical protein
MGLLEAIGQPPDDAARDTFALLSAELRRGLERYWTAAGKILANSGILLQAPPPDYLAMEKNIFSTLFLYSYYAAGIDSDRREFYVAVNQCLRGMVTGCDNLLDDEYKQTLATDLPETAVKFRSVVDIMVSDRVLFELLLDSIAAPLPPAVIQEASAASLRALTFSGAQEAAEEGGVDDIPSPASVLKDVHHYKTGLLFQCPWAVPRVIEGHRGQSPPDLSNHLYRIGMGCQLLDDIVDVSADVRERRYNYLWSTIVHKGRAADGQSLEAFRRRWADDNHSGDLRAAFPETVNAVAAEGKATIERGLHGLLREEHRHLAAPLTVFLVRRIGAQRFTTEGVGA